MLVINFQFKGFLGLLSRQLIIFTRILLATLFVKQIIIIIINYNIPDRLCKTTQQQSLPLK